MKYIALFLVLVACSKSDPGPKYKDITGSWAFTIDSDNSGSFTVVKDGDSFKANFVSMKVNGISYTPANNIQSIENGGLLTFYYRSGSQNNDTTTITIENISFSSGFDKMTAGSYSIQSAVNNYSKSGFNLPITRQ